LSNKLSRLQGLASKYPAALDIAKSFLRRECVAQTLKLTGTDVSRKDIAGASDGRTSISMPAELIRGHLEALGRIERAAEDQRILEVSLFIEVSRLSSGQREVRFRRNKGKIQFAGVTPSRPELIVEKLEDLLGWLRAESGQSLHPPERATLFFTRFLEIAPFEKGNFRSAHLLMNYFGYEKGFPSFFFRAEDSDLLRGEIDKAMRFDTKPLVERMARALHRSLDVCLEGAANNRNVG
jgi:Fic family protein